MLCTLKSRHRRLNLALPSFGQAWSCGFYRLGRKCGLSLSPDQQGRTGVSPQTLPITLKFLPPPGRLHAKRYSLLAEGTWREGRPRTYLRTTVQDGERG